MPATRTFTFSSEGHNKHAYHLTCAKCGEVGALGINKGSGTLAPELVTKKMKQRGWWVGAKPRHDLCPNCSGHVKLPPEVSEEVPMVEKVVAMAPKVMGRDERRLIFEKLNETYIDEHHGYQEGWTDERLAKDLGIPRAWVSQVREEMFGPEKSVATQALLNECKAALSDAKQALVEIRGVEGKILAKVEVLQRCLGQIAA